MLRALEPRPLHRFQCSFLRLQATLLSFSKTQLLKQHLSNSTQNRDPFTSHAGVSCCLGEAALSWCEFSMEEEAASKPPPAFPVLQGKEQRLFW